MIQHIIDCQPLGVVFDREQQALTVMLSPIIGHHLLGINYSWLENCYLQQVNDPQRMWILQPAILDYQIVLSSEFTCINHRSDMNHHFRPVNWSVINVIKLAHFMGPPIWLKVFYPLLNCWWFSPLINHCKSILKPPCNHYSWSPIIGTPKCFWLTLTTINHWLTLTTIFECLTLPNHLQY